MKDFAISLLALSCSFATFAQSDTTPYSRQFLFFIGMQSPDLTELNTVFDTYKYPQLKANNFSVGLGLLKFKKKIVWGVDACKYTLSQSKDTFTSSIRSEGIGVSCGYQYLKKGIFQMYSLLGWNYSLTTVKVSNDIVSNTPFSSYASSIGNQLEMNTWVLTANVATHANVILKVSKDPNEKEHLVLGLRGGYYFPLHKTKWTTNKAKLDKGPTINPGGFYAMLMLGFTF